MGRPAVAVIYGGPGAEHPVSLASASVVMHSLWRAGHRVLPVLVCPAPGSGSRPVDECRTEWRFGQWWEPGTAAVPDPGLVAGAAALSAAEAVLHLARSGMDVVFPVIHGALGEDGRLQGLLCTLGIPFVGSGVLASALAIDKARTKWLLAGITQVALLPSVVLARREWETRSPSLVEKTRHLVGPQIVKPVNSGSSVGLALVRAPEEFEGCLRQVFADQSVSTVLLEEFAVGDEVTCAVLGNPESGLTTFPPILIRPLTGELFDYEAKYTPGRAEDLCPAPLAPEILADVESASREVFRALGARGIGRADFIVRDGVPYFLELNTIPGFTEASLVPLAAQQAGWSRERLFVRLVELALETLPERSREQPA